ncbi:transcriptional repressor NrdR [Oxobacter pfennigii]|uniref:Transcriptional repressor NrdR n=1 Tax=Oxobacter pfennigii TaxID=36849 RepID=A0A0P8X4B8_9CLOT|nr:ATP cone domain-containing protein [Oxobacter pfennigii]KPU45636.1 transcriptional repressor NrdR [Oxobacter pfennigii]
MKVIKRDGRLQEFDINKIKLTVQKASDEIGQPLTGADINNLSKAIDECIRKENRKELPTKDILEIVLDKLIEFGFTAVATNYKEHETNFYKDK